MASIPLRALKNNICLLPSQSGCLQNYPTVHAAIRDAYLLIGRLYAEGHTTIRQVLEVMPLPQGTDIKQMSWYVARGCGALSSEPLQLDSHDFMARFLKGYVKYIHNIKEQCKQIKYEDFIKAYRAAYATIRQAA